MQSIFDENPRRKKSDSSNYKYCQYCGTTMPVTVKYPYCDSCREIILFQKVKDFIRENDVNEFQVAAQFGLPLPSVKGWIKEGRIEYKETAAGAKALNNKLKCERCGAPVTFGTVNTPFSYVYSNSSTFSIVTFNVSGTCSLKVIFSVSVSSTLVG